MRRPADSLPATCGLGPWVVFEPGRHRDGAPGDTYFPVELDRMVANFRALAGGGFHPAAKLGHDGKQRAKESLGFPALGRVVRLEKTPDRRVLVWLADVPTLVGKAVNAGFVRGGSVEVYPKPLPGPDGHDLKPPTLTGLALLGEERPAVLSVGPPPKATFADGSEVPPLSPEEQRWWLDRMADVVGGPSEPGRGDDDSDSPSFEYAGRSYAAVCFSFPEPVPMNRDEMCKAMSAFYGADAFEGKTDDDVAQMFAAMKKFAGEAVGSGAPAPPAAPAVAPPVDPLAADPNAAPQMFSAQAVEKRFAAIENTLSALKPALDQTAAFAAGIDQQRLSAKEARVRRVVNDACGDAKRGLPCRISADPAVIEDWVRIGMTKKDTIDYAAGTAPGRTELDAWEAMMATLPALAYSAQAVRDDGHERPKVKAGATPQGRKVLEGLKDVAPNVYKRLTASANWPPAH